MKTPLIIFDFDGTLADTQRNVVGAMQDVMRELHMPMQDYATCASTIGLPLRKCYAKMFPEMTAEQLEECAQHHYKFFAENLKTMPPAPFPHVRETLTELRSRGITIAIASSRANFSLMNLLRSIKLEGFFTCIIGADDIVHSKPDAEPVLKVLERTGYQAEDTLVVGDMDVDILMGKNAGARACGVTYGNGYKEELLAAGADYIIDGFDEIIGLIND